MGHLQVRVILNRRATPDLDVANRVFGWALDQMKGRAENVDLQSEGHNLHIQSGDVTGITEVQVADIKVAMTPNSPGQLGVLLFEVNEHPDGVDAAVQLAEELVKRVSEAFHIELRKTVRLKKKKRNNSFEAWYQVSGWQGQFDRLYVTYKPA